MAFQIGVEDKAALIDIFKQHNARTGLTLRIDGGQRHRGRISI